MAKPLRNHRQPTRLHSWARWGLAFSLGVAVLCVVYRGSIRESILCYRLDSVDAEIRRNALEALLARRSVRLVSPCIEALAFFGPEEGPPRFGAQVGAINRQVFHTETWLTPWPASCHRAIEALGASALAPLREEIRSEKRLERLWAIWLLGRAGQRGDTRDSTRPLLEGLLPLARRGDDDVRLQATIAIGHLVTRSEEWIEQLANEGRRSGDCEREQSVALALATAARDLAESCTRDSDDTGEDALRLAASLRALGAGLDSDCEEARRTGTRGLAAVAFELPGANAVATPALTQALRRALDDPAARVRALAVRALGYCELRDGVDRYPEAVLDSIVYALEDSDPEVRREAAGLLRGGPGIERRLVDILERLGDGDEDVRRLTLSLAITLGPQLVPALGARLRSLRQMTEREATWCASAQRELEGLAEICRQLGPDARDLRAPLLDVLIAAGGDVSPRVAESLGDVGSHCRDGVDDLSRTLGSPQPRLQVALCRALARYGTFAEAAAPAVLRLFDAQDASVRREALSTLDAIGGIPVGHWRRVLVERSDASVEPDVSARRLAAELLAKGRKSDTVPSTETGD